MPKQENAWSPTFAKQIKNELLWSVDKTMNIECVFPIEIFIQIAGYNIFTLGVLKRCCRKLSKIDISASLLTKYNAKTKDYIGYLHFHNKWSNVEYIHYEQWYIWIIRRNNDEEPSLRIKCDEKNISLVFNLDKSKIWGDSGRDIHGCERWHTRVIYGKYYYSFNCCGFLLDVVFTSIFRPIIESVLFAPYFSN